MKYTFPLFITILFTLSLGASAQLQKINTLAGNGTPGFSGDGFNAAAAQMHGVMGVAVDTAGNVYVEDFYNLRVRKVATNGKIYTIAGTGLGGNTGDGSLGTSANLHPHGVAVDKTGNIYISDAIYGVIRKVNATTGFISTYAGTGVLGFSGDGGLATAAKLGGLHGMAFDSHGNLFVADSRSHTVRKITTAGIISTVAGSRSSLNTDTAGFWGDGGPATAALLDSPMAVAVDKRDRLFITDYKNNVIRMVDTSGEISTYAGFPSVYGYSGDGALATTALLNKPQGIAFDAIGNLYICDAENSVIRMVDTFGIISTAVGNGTAGYGGDGGYVNGCNLFNPYGIAVDKYGQLYIADANNHRVRKTYSTVDVPPVCLTGDITVHPNPASTEVNVTGVNENDNIIVTDVTGRSVYSGKADQSGIATISVASLVKGLYLVQVADASGTRKASLKMVKN